MVNIPRHLLEPLRGTHPHVADALEASEADMVEIDTPAGFYPAVPSSTYRGTPSFRIPPRTKPPSLLLGDLTAILLRMSGSVAAARLLTLGRWPSAAPQSCGCHARQGWLNRHEKSIHLALWILTLALYLIALARPR